MGAATGLQRLIISAPFGNYIQPRGCTATLGTFTAARRPGRLWRVIKTVRYYRRLKAWVNQIGLRNPGMEWLVERVEAGRVSVTDKIVSVHGFCDEDWIDLLEQIEDIKPLAVELNMSCPNIGEINWPDSLFHRAISTQVPVIVKLPPVHYRAMFLGAVAAGIRAFHCCNTLPVPAGGMSGKPLKPFAIQCIRDIREHPPGSAPGLTGELMIIGGGGITVPADIDDYAAVGATHFAIGTKVFHPKFLLTHRPLAPLIERTAQESVGAGTKCAG